MTSYIKSPLTAYVEVKNIHGFLKVAYLYTDKILVEIDEYVYNEPLYEQIIPYDTNKIALISVPLSCIIASYSEEEITEIYKKRAEEEEYMNCFA